MKRISFLLLPFFIHQALPGQTRDSLRERPYEQTAQAIVASALRSGHAYAILKELSEGIGPRLSGSEGAAKAVEWSRKKMEDLGFAKVHLEPVMVPHWVRGAKEEAVITDPKSLAGRKLRVCALGGSIGTGSDGVTADILEVHSFDELRNLGSQAKGKIIFFNRPMDPARFSTFEAYGGAVNQRGSGAVEAARAGGVASITRSMTTRIDNSPHTGAMNYNDSIPKVPAAAIATADANFIDDALNNGKDMKVRLTLSCETLPDAESANVVGELTGTERPGEVVLIGAHLDSWDLGRGAHDDGTGCAHIMEALRLLKELGLAPKRTIRCVTYMNEENGDHGGKAYAALARPGEKHIAAIETDAGGFEPRGFGVTADSNAFTSIARWSYLLDPIDAGRIHKGGGGTDISELGKQGVPLLGLNVDGQRYFDYHHSENDVIGNVNERELELGAASLAILAYVLAQEGI